jgi:hypothetical protein
MQQHGLQNGGNAAQSGVFSSGAYGVGQRQNTEAAQQEAQLRVGASAQAQQQKFQQDQANINSLLQRAGFEQGLSDASFQNEYQVYLARLGLTQEQIQAEVEQLKMWMNPFGSVLPAMLSNMANRGEQQTGSSGQTAGGDASTVGSAISSL